VRLALLALAWSCSATAAEGDAFLAQVMAGLAQHEVVRARFLQERFVSAMPAPVASRGRMTVSRREGLIWRVEDPVQVALAFTPTQIIETGPDGARRVVSPRRGGAQAEMGRLIRSLTATDVAELRSSFELQVSGSLERWIMELKPRRREMARFLSAIRLSGGRYLETIDIHETSGERTFIRMTGFVTAAALDATERAELTPP
jgi:hypothetical protein